MPLNKYIEYAYLVEELEVLSNKYDDLMGFIYVIKATLHSLNSAIGDVYGFNDEYFKTVTY